MVRYTGIMVRRKITERVHLLVLLVALALMCSGRMPWREARYFYCATADYHDCKSNIKNLSTACEMYSTDNSGRYPTSLAQLTPQYLKELPTCPAVSADTYSEGFQSVSNPDAFSVVCTGWHHPFVDPPNYPQYCTLRDCGLREE